MYLQFQDKEELRDFKLSLLESNYILEFDSDTIPRLPSKTETIIIGNRSFKMEDHETHYITENNQVYNVFNIFVFDFEKSEKQEEEKMFQKMLKLSNKSFGSFRLEERIMYDKLGILD